MYYNNFATNKILKLKCMYSDEFDSHSNIVKIFTLINFGA